jgi:pimeloyl-ACP methyl ester carboxylesterase
MLNEQDMTRLVLDDELLDAQVLRAAGSALYGGGDLGECLMAARSVDVRSLDSWYHVWTALAARTSELAQEQEEAGRLESARLAYLRASTYYRTAGVMLLRPPVDERLVASNRLQTGMFRRAAALMPTPVETITIPYQGTTLPGYFCAAAPPSAAHGDGVLRRPTVILTGGYDGTAEELYFFNGAAALARGYNVLTFDGPGQGAALLQQGLTLRPDWEKVISPVIDYASTRADVDPARLALIGLSLGAHLAPRAAAHEPRIAALIADCGSFDLQASFLARMPPPLAQRYRAGRRTTRVLLRQILRFLARKPSAGWALRRGMLVHGAASGLAYLDDLARYSLKEHAHLIRCPVWVCHAEDDDIGSSAPDLAAAIGDRAQLVRFTGAEGAGDHCEQAARALYHARSFGWLDGLLRPVAPGSTPP